MEICNKPKPKQTKQDKAKHQNKSKSKYIWESGTRNLLRVFSIIYIATRNRKHISLNARVRRHAHTQ